MKTQKKTVLWVLIQSDLWMKANAKRLQKGHTWAAIFTKALKVYVKGE